MSVVEIKNKELYGKIKMIANKFRFQIIEITQDQELTISELSKKLNLSYTKCADYISMLEKEGLINKRKDGKEVFIKSKIDLQKIKSLFSFC